MFHETTAIATGGAGTPGTLSSRPVPELSIVIPTLGQGGKLSRALDHLATARRAADVETIVVRDAKAENPGAIDEAAARARPYPTRVLDAPAPGASAARNAGWQAATTPLILFLGDDIFASRRLISEHLAFHARHPEPELGALGHVRWAKELDVTPFMRWLEHGTQFDYYSFRHTDPSWGNLYTANVSLKREMLDRVGGFDEERFPYLYEDTDLGYRLYEEGFRLRYVRRADAEHLHPATLADWQRRMAAVARAERTWVELHPDLEPHFHDRLTDAMSWPPSQGRLARAALRFIPPTVPVLGRKVSERASVHYRQQLAPAFLEAWDQARERSASSGGSEPGGP